MKFLRKLRLSSVLGASIVAAVAGLGIVVAPAATAEFLPAAPPVVAPLAAGGCENLPDGGLGNVPIGSDSAPAVVVGGNFSAVPGAKESEGIMVVGGDASVNPGSTMTGLSGETGGGIYNLGVVGVGSGITAPGGADTLVTGGTVHVESGRLAINESNDPDYQGGHVRAGLLVSDADKAKISRNLPLIDGQEPAWKDNLGRDEALSNHRPWIDAVTRYSDFYTSLPANGAVQRQTWSELTLTGDNTSERQVFNVDASQLSTEQTPLEVRFHNIAPEAVIVINVTGNNPQAVVNFFGLNGERAFVGAGSSAANNAAFVKLATHLIWNFADADSVYVGRSDQFLGSVLVKNPASQTILGTSTNGRILVAGNLQQGQLTTSTGGELPKGLEMHNFPFVDGFGCNVPPTDPGTPKNYAVGDLVWIDANNDGIQDPAEGQFLAGVSVSLLNAAGDTLATTSTNSSGRYLFDSLPAGEYQLKFELTAEQAAKYEFTLKKMVVNGSGADVDSDAAPATGLSEKFTLGAGNAALVQADAYTAQPFTATGGIDPTWDAGVVLKNGNLSLVKAANPASGTTVKPGDTVIYTVTASAQDGRATNVVISDDLSDVLDDAAFIPGSATLVIDGETAVHVADPAADPVVAGKFVLATEPFDIPAGAQATLSYSVTVKADSWSRTLRNVVTGTANGPVTDCSSCSTTHPTPARVFIEKLGENINSEFARMDGSAWAVFTDDAGTLGAPLTSPAVVAVPGEVGLFALEAIPAGTYWLSETQAPESFNLLAEPVQFTVAADGTLTLGAGTGDGVVTVSAQAGTATITVRDVPALQLPESGGTGGSLILAGGTLLLLVAVFLTARSRKAPLPAGE